MEPALVSCYYREDLQKGPATGLTHIVIQKQVQQASYFRIETALEFLSLKSRYNKLKIIYPLGE